MELYAGQGAYSDPGNNIWNGFGYTGQYGGYGSTYYYSGGTGSTGPFPQQFGNPGNPYAAYNMYTGWISSTGPAVFDFNTGSPTATGNATSSGQFTPVTLSVGGYVHDAGLFDSLFIGTVNYYVVPNGTPGFLLGECASSSGSEPGDVVFEKFTLQHVPAGTYGLFLYGANYDNNGGTLFAVSSGSPHNGIAATLNNGNGIPAHAFVEGANFVIFENVTPDANGDITITASPNPQAGVGNANVSGEADVNGFQLIFNPAPAAVASTAAQNVFAGATASFAFTPVFAHGASFQWQSIIGGVTSNLSDGGNISGSATPNLTIANVSAANVGLYQCVITTATGTGVTPAAPLTLLTCPATGPLQPGVPASAVGNILQPGDTISDFNNYFGFPFNSVPPLFVATNVVYVEDGTLSPYFNTGYNADAAPFYGPVGFIVTPNVGSTVVKGMRLWAASSHPEDDPADYGLEGSNDGGVTFTHIAGGGLAIPPQRNAAGGAINFTNQVLQELTFPNNTTAYGTYRLSFTNVVNDTVASNGLQLAEVQLLGSWPAAAPVVVQEPVTNVVLLVGQTLEATVTVSGAGPLTFQWFYNTSTPIPNATNATLTLANVQPANSGNYGCTISNPYGSTSTMPLSLTVVAPTPYEAAVRALEAVCYYPLNEASGTTAAEVLYAKNGTYQINSTLGEPGVANPPFAGFPANDLAVEIWGTIGDSWVSVPFGNLAGPDGQTLPNVTFTCWIYPLGSQNASLGLIFDRGNVCGGLDMSQGAGLGMLGYTWNNNNGDTYNFVSGLTPPQNQWSLAAVTIAPDAAILYLLNSSGRSSATNAIPHFNGVMDGAWRIGNDALDDPARSFNGMMNAVAVFTNALSGAQLNALYDIAAFGTTNIAPVVQVPTSAIAADVGGQVSIPALVVDGPPPYAYQWYDVVNGVSGLLPGATNSTLVLSNLVAAQGAYKYFVVVSNPYGAGTSPMATLDLLSGPPVLTVNVSPAFSLAPAGAPLSFAVSATGTMPFSYQWAQDGAAISGATASSYSFNALAGTNTYDVTVTGPAGHVVSSTAVVVGTTTAPPVITFNGNGTGWKLNQPAGWPGAATDPNITANVLTLTDGVNSENCSAFYAAPQYIGGFIATFTYQEAPGNNPLADGATFCIQNCTNSSVGLTTNAIGGGGGQLGYVGIAPSAALELNLYSGSPGGTGWAFSTDSNTPQTESAMGPYLSTAPIILIAGDPVFVQLYYCEKVATLWMVDPRTGAIFTTSFALPNLPAIVGGPSAFIGFTGGTGGENSTQTISNFVFSSTTPPILSVARGATPGTVVVSWPVSVSTLFKLQQSSAAPGPYSNVSATPVVVNGQNQVTLTAAAGATFYRLSLQ